MVENFKDLDKRFGLKPPMPGQSKSDPYRQFLEGDTRAAFFGTLEGGGGGPNLLGTPARRRQAEDVYQQAMQGFYGSLGKQALQGQAPTLQFTDYIKSFPFTERFAQLGRQQNRASRYRPPTRRLFF